MRPRRGFTLIELLIVVVIIGLLASIAIPKFRESKGKAYWAAMRSDLHNLAQAQEGYYYENRGYSASLDSIGFQVTEGVTIVIGFADNTGWSAVSTHKQAYPHKCAIFMGGAPPQAPASVEGVVGCQ